MRNRPDNYKGSVVINKGDLNGLIQKKIEQGFCPITIDETEHL